jgi:flagellar motor protein MotB
MANDFSDPDLMAMQQRKFPIAWVLLLLTVIGVAGFVAGAYLPLYNDHKKLRPEHEALAKSARAITDELKQTQEKLKGIEEDRNKLKSTVDANDQRTKGAAQRGNDLSQKLETALEKRVKQKLATVTQADNTVSVRIPNGALFTANGVGVTRQGASLLCEVAKAMPTSEAVLTIAVHAADAEVNAALAKNYKTIWDVTAAQAAAAAQILTKQCGVDAAKVTASAHGTSQPIEGADKADNARAELWVAL